MRLSVHANFAACFLFVYFLSESPLLLNSRNDGGGGGGGAKKN